MWNSNIFLFAYLKKIANHARTIKDDVVNTADYSDFQQRLKWRRFSSNNMRMNGEMTEIENFPAGFGGWSANFQQVSAVQENDQLDNVKQKVSVEVNYNIIKIMTFWFHRPGWSIRVE